MSRLIQYLCLVVIAVLAVPEVAAERRINIDKASYTLTVVDGDSTLFRAPVCLGRNRGQKTRQGDMKTPEGDFTISMIQNSSAWTHDFGDGKGQRKGAYGPWFFRLKTPMSRSIGIHGTCFPETTGTRASEGCIRLRNEDLLELRKYVFKGMKVHITAD